MKENASLKLQLRTTKAQLVEMARWKTRYLRLQLSHVCTYHIWMMTQSQSLLSSSLTNAVQTDHCADPRPSAPSPANEMPPPFELSTHEPATAAVGQGHDEVIVRLKSKVVARKKRKFTTMASRTDTLHVAIEAELGDSSPPPPPSAFLRGSLAPSKSWFVDALDLSVPPRPMTGSFEASESLSTVPCAPAVMDKMVAILTQIRAQDTRKDFFRAVHDAEYRRLIRYPMDFGKILRRIEECVYSNVGALLSDMDLVWSNCYLFHGKATLSKGCFSRYAHGLQWTLDAYVRQLQRELKAKGWIQTASEAPASSTSDNNAEAELDEDAETNTSNSLSNNATDQTSTQQMVFRALKLQCTHCSAIFAKTQALYSHIRSTHQRHTKCPRCSRKLQNMAAFVHHVRTHTGEKPYYCPVDGCDYEFAQKQNLKTHLASKAHGGKANLVKFAKVLDLDVCDEVLRKRKIPPLLDSKDDIAMELFGVSIGTHGDFWDGIEHARPKLVLRRHGRSLQLVLRNSHDVHMVSVLISLRHVRWMFIADDASLNTSRSIQVLFLQTDAQLAAHSWLSSYYDPRCAEMPAKQRIALFAGAKDYAKLKHALLGGFALHSPDDKELWLSHIRFPADVKARWRTHDAAQTWKRTEEQDEAESKKAQATARDYDEQGESCDTIVADEMVATGPAPSQHMAMPLVSTQNASDSEMMEQVEHSHQHRMSHEPAATTSTSNTGQAPSQQLVPTSTSTDSEISERNPDVLSNAGDLHCNTLNMACCSKKRGGIAASCGECGGTWHLYCLEHVHHVHDAEIQRLQQDGESFVCFDCVRAVKGNLKKLKHKKRKAESRSSLTSPFEVSTTAHVREQSASVTAPEYVKPITDVSQFETLSRAVHAFNSLVLDEQTRWYAEELTPAYFERCGLDAAEYERYMHVVDHKPMDFGTVRVE